MRADLCPQSADAADRPAAVPERQLGGRQRPGGRRLQLLPHALRHRGRRRQTGRQAGPGAEEGRRRGQVRRRHRGRSNATGRAHSTYRYNSIALKMQFVVKWMREIFFCESFVVLLRNYRNLIFFPSYLQKN